MKKFKKTIVLLLIIAMVLSFAGCKDNTTPVDKPSDIQQENTNNEEQNETNASATFENLYPEFILNETEETVTYVDWENEETIVTKKPEKVVVLYNSILDLWYLSGGEAIARVKGTTNVPEAAMDLIDLGSWNKVSIEAVLALEPDFVILSHNVSSQREFKEVLKQNGIEYALIDVSTNAYQAFQKNVYLFSKILGTEDIYNTKALEITNTCEDIIDKAKAIEKKPSVAVLYSSSRSIKTETENSLTGEMISLLGAENIVKVEDVPIEGETRVDFSMETLIASDPDYILICTMGKVDACKEKITKDLESNPVWSELSAVKEGKVYFLPKEYSVYKPNAKYPEAFEYLAKLIYPEEFND